MGTDYADILNVRIQDGELRFVLGDAITGTGIAQDASMWGSGRFISVPKPPDANGAAQAVYEQDGQTVRMLGWSDNRIAAKAGSLAEGDLAIVGYGAARFLMKDADDSLTVYTETESGDSIILTVSGRDARIWGAIGGSSVEIAKDEITIIGGGCSITMSEGTITLSASSILLAGSRVSLGLIPPGIPPTTPAQGVVWGPAGITAVGSTTVFVAP